MGEYRTGFAAWGALSGASGDLSGWRLSGAAFSGGAIVLDPARAAKGADPWPAGGYEGGSYHNGGSFLVGEAEGPVFEARFPFLEAVPSWRAETPAGTWIEVRLRVRQGGDWTPWYVHGVWASGEEPVRRHSVTGQEDERASVQTDKLSLKAPAEALQIKVLLYRAEGATGEVAAPPRLRAASVAYSTKPFPRGAAPEPSAPALPPVTIAGVPAYSQLAYPDGGNVWCSPTCLSMVLAHWEGEADGGSAAGVEALVRRTVASVYDRVYGGHGNWSFCASYAGSLGYEARVARFESLAAAEPWIAAGVPVIMSLSWNDEAGRPLTGAPIPKSSGHLTLLVGFDAKGDPVMNEPASKDPALVRRSYRRAELEARWLESSGGTAYLICPPGRRVPELA